MYYDSFFVFFFFFKQKTAYEMVRSDWSSDVCSSDLYGEREREEVQHIDHQVEVVVIRRDRIDRGRHDSSRTDAVPSCNIVQLATVRHRRQVSRVVPLLP